MDKELKYEKTLQELGAIWDNQIQLVGNLANVCAVLKTEFGFWWVGFYQVKSGELQLSVFQGSVACTRIAFGKGVCGTSWKEKQTIVVPDVHEFPGHIACSAASQSEIVVPVFTKINEVWGVLDIDSEHLNHFDEFDKVFLEKLVLFLKDKI
jgi:L-methionine (R)-S-oxide reductase